MRGAAAAFFDGRYAALAITLKPQVTGGPRNIELATHPAERLRATQGTNDKLHTLLSNFHLLPRHRFPTSARAKV
jgi:hypothetical protein